MNLLSDYGLDELGSEDSDSGSEVEVNAKQGSPMHSHAKPKSIAAPSVEINETKDSSDKLPSFEDLNEWNPPDYLKSQFGAKETTSEDFFMDEEALKEAERKKAQEKWSLPPQPTKEDKKREMAAESLPVPVPEHLRKGLKRGVVGKDEALRASKRMTKAEPQSFKQKEKRKRNIGQQSRGKNYVEEEKRVLRKAMHE